MSTAAVRILLWAVCCLLLWSPVCADEPFTLPSDSGYRGLWYSNQKTNDEYVYKYSGGMATYPQQHLPIAIHAPAVNKTFFVYGGTPADKRSCLHMVSYFDHATGTVPRPRILLDKATSDAHDNPTLTIDRDGHLWIFSNSHGTARPSFVHRSSEPYSIDRFERTASSNFSYGQPWAMHDGSLLHMHTRYNQGHREMFVQLSRDGRDWTDVKPLARIENGHYQVRWSDGRRVATAFNFHPSKGGLNARTNLYYMVSDDLGKTWRSAAGESLSLPLESADNAALAHNYQPTGRLVYLKQLQFDANGHPVVLYLTSGGYAPGPANDPRTWHVARWDGTGWIIRDITTSDHNYDFGSLYLEADGTWRLIAPTEPGAQPYGTGGDMVLWTSRDQGATWQQVKRLTHDPRFNHSYARQPLHAHPGFYAIWADGDTRAPSKSSLYFTDQAGSHVWKLPEQMSAETAPADIAW